MTQAQSPSFDTYTPLLMGYEQNLLMGRGCHGYGILGDGKMQSYRGNTVTMQPTCRAEGAFTQRQRTLR